MPSLPQTAPHWVKYDPRRQIIETATVSRLAELAHRRLADSVWATGRWPKAGAASLVALARATPRECPGLLAELRSLGWHPRAGTLVHHGIQDVLDAALTAQTLASRSGRRAANTRWKPLPPPPEPSDAERMADALPPHVPPDMPAHCERNASESQIETQTQTPYRAFNAERLTLSVSTRKAGAGPEKAFLAEVSEAFGKSSPKIAQTELVNWGGWWRNRFREDPAKARRVLAETNSMIKEHRILENPGAAAADLWKRLP